jgi:hypothetical protein
LSGYKVHASKVWFIQFESVLKVLPKTLTLESIRDLSVVFNSISRMSGPSKKDFPELQDFYEGIKSLKEFIQKYSEDFLLFDQKFQEVVLPTYKLYQEIINFIDDHYNDLPGFVFADLAYIVNLGLTDIETRKRIAETYKFFIVDEFQDTSFLQYSILQKLSLSNYDRLFAVGDLKQAIYGFRGGELKVFRTLEESIPLNLNLSNNYRSLPTIIHFNNQLFTCLFHKGLDFEGVDFSPVPVIHQKVPLELAFEDHGSLNKIIIDPVFASLEDKGKLSNFMMNELEAKSFVHYLKEKSPWDKKESVAILYRSLGPVDNLIFKLIDQGLSFTAQVKIPFLEDPMIGIFKVLIEELLHKKIQDPSFDFTYSTFLIEKYLQLLAPEVSFQREFVNASIAQFHSDFRMYGLKTSFTEFIYRLGISNSNYKNNLIMIHEFCDEFSTDLEKLWDQLNHNEDKYSFDLSTNAGLNVNSKDNQKRQNMPNINNSFELGVLFRYFLWKDENKENMLNFEMPIRSVFVTNFKSIDHIGYFSIPYLNFLSRPQHWNGFWSMEFSVGPMYGSKKLHNYHYSIAPDFSNPDRPAYESKPGYSGTQIALVMSKRIKKLLIFPWIRYDNLKGAAFIDSPLIETNHYVMGGIGLVYFFAQSGSLQRNDFQVK